MVRRSDGAPDAAARALLHPISRQPIITPDHAARPPTVVNQASCPPVLAASSLLLELPGELGRSREI
jgi:hypothetical protein